MQQSAKDKQLMPLLKWAGSKRWLVPKIAEIYQAHRDRVWVDPFCGSLALPLALQPKRAKLRDINPCLINLYQCVQDPNFKYLGTYQNTEDEYYKAREAFNRPQAEGEDYEQAELFLYLNRTCFNGLCRFNRNGDFNVPYGKYDNPKLDWDFTPYREVFENWNFGVSDYKNVDIDKQDFVYLDPPYDDGFVSYFGNPFGWEQQQQLAQWAGNLPTPVVISNKATDRILNLYEFYGFKCEFVSAPRSISCNGNRDRVMEVLASKNL